MYPFAEAGAENPADAGGAGTPAPEAPSIETPSLPSVANTPVDLSHDPRYQAIMARLQPAPQPTGWDAALQKILPMLGAVVAMHQNAGGSFVNAYTNLQQQQQQQKDRQTADDVRLFNVLHQQAQEQEAARRTDANLTMAQQRLTAAAAKAAADKRDKLMRDEWTAQSQGGLVNTLNDLIDKSGPDAADRYMASTNIGSLTEAGVPHTVKDLVDKYAVKGPDGHYVGGKTKTPKEIVAGSKEEYVLRARDMAAKTFGHPLTDDEQQQVDEKALKRYGDITKDTDTTAILKGLQIDTATLHNEVLRQQFERGLAEKYGSTPIVKQDADGVEHVYFVKKGENGQPPSLFELKDPAVPKQLYAPKRPGMLDTFTEWAKSIWGDKKPAIQVIGGGTPSPTDPTFIPQ